ncbi:hypothetical protein QE382_002981 [Sphingobacterium zeae]|uniref:3-keto-disaccharide hydrolase domain-containing protein n=1 Tax=Sphingobacterium zeae TaxID=1776859 RepID=A0ABU0U7Q8_9SPHI|nr:hypothetical protein [Sphingobacterium zeae]MDQ1150997.1 hypothetical protein [Sphingobacterium zeae]
MTPNNVLPSQVATQLTNFKGQNALQVKGPTDGEKTMALLKDIDFHNGVIEVSIAGQPMDQAGQAARGFVGVAFRTSTDISKTEIFYLRPTNGRAEEQLRRNHATQYISIPGYPWEKLREETPGKYEAYADMEPGEWIKVKIEVNDEKAKLYLNESSQPTLIVNDLKQGKDLRGSIGLWVGPGTLGHFKDLKLVKAD